MKRQSRCSVSAWAGARGWHGFAGGRDFIAEHAGAGANAQNAQPYIDQFLRLAESLAGWPANSAKGEWVDDIEGRREGDRRAQAGLRHPRSRGLLRAAQEGGAGADRRGQGQDLQQGALLARRQGSRRYKSLADLKGKKVSSNHFASPKYISKVGFDGKIDVEKDFMMVKAAAPSKPLKDVDRGARGRGAHRRRAAGGDEGAGAGSEGHLDVAGAAADAGGGVHQERDAGRSRGVRQGAAEAVRGRQGQGACASRCSSTQFAPVDKAAFTRGRRSDTTRSAQRRSRAQKSEHRPPGGAGGHGAPVAAGCPVPPIKSGATVTTDKLPEKVPELVKYADDIYATPGRLVGGHGECAARARQGDQGRSEGFRRGVEGGAHDGAWLADEFYDDKTKRAHFSGRGIDYAKAAIDAPARARRGALLQRRATSGSRRRRRSSARSSWCRRCVTRRRRRCRSTPASTTAGRRGCSARCTPRRRRGRRRSAIPTRASSCCSRRSSAGPTTAEQSSLRQCAGARPRSTTRRRSSTSSCCSAPARPENQHFLPKWKSRAKKGAEDCEKKKQAALSGNQ